MNKLDGSSILKPLFLIFLCLAFSVSLAAAEDRANTVEIQRITITNATEDNFIAETGNFLLKENTIIYDVDGNKTKLQYLPLPCVADVTFNPSDGKPAEVIQIRVTTVLEKKARREVTLPE